MAARNKEIATRSVGDLGLDVATVGGAVATTAVLNSRQPPARAATEVVRGTPAEGAVRIVDFLAERRLI
jgi:electron transfer flavoprotein alpha/beta subunit